MKEIGSEFWLEDFKDSNDNVFDNIRIGTDQKFFAFGRTALDFIIRDIGKKNGIAYLPDYCCQSMVQPFIDNGYKVEYYKVNLVTNKYEIDINKNCDVFFATSYFGYSSTNMDNIINAFSARNIAIIEDITHRLLCNNSHCNNSTYIFCSLRKWFPIISGSFCSKNNNRFVIKESSILDAKYIDKRKHAMKLKKDYIENNTAVKKNYIQLYEESNALLTKYKNKAMDNESIEILKKISYNSVISKRKANATIIYEMLKNNNIQTLKLNPDDTPLFVPIFLKNQAQRDKLREYAVNHSIYLPIHWPIEEQPKSIQTEIELSLVCDQRYNEKEIKSYISTLLQCPELANE